MVPVPHPPITLIQVQQLACLVPPQRHRQEQRAELLGGRFRTINRVRLGGPPSVLQQEAAQLVIYSRVGPVDAHSVISIIESKGVRVPRVLRGRRAYLARVADEA